MNSADAVIYRGSAFTIEWFFDARGTSPAREYYEMLSVGRRAKFLRLVRLMGEIGRIFDSAKFRNEGDQIFAFKPQPDRFLCFFFTGRKIIVTNAFEKKSQKMPHGEKDRAMRAKRDFEERTKKGLYYEKE
jgi:phage-related protein